MRTRNIHKRSHVHISDNFNRIILPHFPNIFREHGLTILMSFQSYMKPPARPDCLFNEILDVNDSKNVHHSYTPIAILLISRFSDSIAVVKQESQGYIQFPQDDYSHSVPLSYSRFSDLIDTSSSILIFHHQVRKKSTLLSLLYV